jgi:hypothetical protein
MATVYALGLVGGTLATMAASYVGSNLTDKKGETPPKLEPVAEQAAEPIAEQVVAPTEQPPQESVEEAPTEDLPDEEVPAEQVLSGGKRPRPEEEQDGGGFGRPSWAPLNPQSSPPPTLGALVTQVTQAVPSTASGIQEELNKVTRDLEDTSYSIYEIEGSLKSKSADFEKIRSSYQAAVITKRVTSIEVARLTKDLEPKKDNEPKVGGKPNEFIDTLKKVLETDVKRKDTETNSQYNARIIDLVNKSNRDELKKYKPTAGDLRSEDSKNKWFERMRSSGSGAASAPAETIEQKIKKLTDAETKLFQAENTILEKKEDYENLLKEITDLRTKLTDLKIRRNSAETRRVALIGALTTRNKIPTDVTSEFVPASAAEVQEILIKYNKQLSEIQTAERNLKLYFIANFPTSEDRNKLQGLSLGSVGITSEQTKFLTDNKALADKKKELEKIKLELAGASKGTISELNVLLNTLRQNGVAGADEALGNSTIQTVFNTYKKISEAPNANAIIVNLDEYWKTFGTKSDWLVGYNGQTVSRAFLYVNELYKRQSASENVEIANALKKFMDDNARIAYKALAKLEVTKVTIDKNNDPSRLFLDTSDAVDALLEGRSVSYNKLVKGVSGKLEYFKTPDKTKIESLVNNFKARIIDKFIAITLNTGLPIVGKKEVYAIDPREIRDKVADLIGKIIESPVEDPAGITGNTDLNIENIISYASRLSVLLEGDDELANPTINFLENPFENSRDSAETYKKAVELQKGRPRSYIEENQLGKQLSKFVIDEATLINSIFENIEKSKAERIEKFNETLESVDSTEQEKNTEKSVMRAYIGELLYYKLPNLKNKIINIVYIFKLFDKQEEVILQFNSMIERIDTIAEGLRELIEQSAEADNGWKDIVKIPSFNLPKLPSISIPKFPVLTGLKIWDFFKKADKHSPELSLPPLIDGSTGPTGTGDPAAGVGFGTDGGKRHSTRKHWVRSKPSRSKTHRTY